MTTAYASGSTYFGSSSARSATCGVISDGLQTAGLPDVIAAMSGIIEMANRKFQGEITNTRPFGVL